MNVKLIKIFQIIRVKINLIMGHLALIERLKVIKIYNMLEVGCKYKYQVISRIAKSNFGIEISARGVRSLVDN